MSNFETQPQLKREESTTRKSEVIGMEKNFESEELGFQNILEDRESDRDTDALLGRNIETATIIAEGVLQSSAGIKRNTEGIVGSDGDMFRNRVNEMENRIKNALTRFTQAGVIFLAAASHIETARADVSQNMHVLIDDLVKSQLLSYEPVTNERVNTSSEISRDREAVEKKLVALIGENPQVRILFQDLKHQVLDAKEEASAVISLKKDGKTLVHRSDEEGNDDEFASMSLGGSVATIRFDKKTIDDIREEVFVHTHPISVGQGAIESSGFLQQSLPKISHEKVAGIVDGKMYNAMPPSSEDILQAYMSHQSENIEGLPKHRNVVADGSGVWWFDANSANEYLKKAVQESNGTVQSKEVLTESLVTLVDPDLAQEIKETGDEEVSPETIKARLETFSKEYIELMSMCGLSDNAQDEKCQTLFKISDDYTTQLTESVKNGKTTVYQQFVNDYTLHQMRLFNPVDSPEVLRKSSDEFSEYAWKTYGVKAHHFSWEELSIRDKE